MCAVLYRALRGVGLFPPVIDEMELWQVAVEMNEDIGFVPRRVFTVDEPAPTPDGVPLGPRLVDAD